jgi:protein tyrosine phosphatase type 4A
MGRAPFLVALALIYMGMDNYEAVDLIRGARRGAINTRQLDYILAYKVCRRALRATGQAQPSAA